MYWPLNKVKMDRNMHWSAIENLYNVAMSLYLTEGRFGTLI